MPAKDIEIRVKVQVTGLAGLQQLGQALSQISAAQKSMTTTVTNVQKAVQKQQQAVKKQTQAVQELSGSFKKFTQDMTHNIYKVLEWGLATGVIYGSVRALRQALLDVGDVDFAIAGLTKVMGDASDRSRRLAKDVQVLASQYGEMGDILINATTEWARLQGSNLEIMEGTRAALLAQAVAEMQVTDATRLLIAELKQFEQPLLNSVRLIDQWNELSNTFAVRAIDIAQAAARAGGVMHNMGVEMERLHGYTTALVQSTGRSGEAIGTALRTIATYTYRMQTMAALSELASINITDLKESQLGLNQVLDQVAINWGTYTDATQKAIAQTMAGTRRVNEFITLMEQYPVALEATVKAWRSVGSAEKEAATFMDTVRKQLDRTHSLMQRLVTEGGVLAGAFKLMIGQMNNFIQGLIVLKPLILATVAALVAWKVANYLMIAGLKYLKYQIIDLVTIHLGLNPTLLAVAAAMAVVTTAAGYMAARHERAAEAAKKMRDIAYANVRALRAEADELGILTESYKKHISELGRAVDQPSLYSSQQIERMVENLNDIAMRLERITGVSFEEFEMETSNWAEALEKVDQKLADINEQALKGYEERRIALRGEIDDQKKVIKFWQILADNIDSLRGPTGNYLNGIIRAREALRDSGASAKELGIYLGVFVGSLKEAGIDVDKIPDSLKAARAVLDDLDSQLKGLERTVEELSSVLSPEDVEAMLERLGDRLAVIEDSYEHFAAAAEFAGESQADVARLALQAIDEQILAVQRLNDAYSEEEKITQKTGPMLNRLYRERGQLINKIIQAGWPDEEKRLNDLFKEEVSSLKAGTAAMVQYVRQTEGSVAASQKQIEGYQRLIDATKRRIASLKQVGADTSDAEAEVRNLSEALAIEKAMLEGLYIPMQRYAEATERLNTAHAGAVAMMQARKASAVELAQLDVDAARRAFDTAESDLDRKNAASALQLAKDRLKAAMVAGKYADAVEAINQKLQENVILSQAAGSNTVAVARLRVKAAQDILAAAKDMSDQEKDRLRDELNIAVATLNAARASERAEKYSIAYAGAVDKLQNSHQREIATLELVGATEEQIASKQVEHAKEVLIQVKQSARAYSSWVDWIFAVMDAQAQLDAGEARFATARLRRLRDQAAWEYDLLQSRHDFEIDLMGAMGSSTRQRVEERIDQLGREFEFAVTSSKLTADQRREMAQALYRDLLDESRQYELDQIDTAKSIAEAYVQQFQRIEDQWIATVREMATGSPLQAILRAMDRVFSDWFEKQVRDRWGGFIKKLTGIEIGLTGKSPEELRQEEAKRQKDIAVFMQGGDYVEASIKEGVTALSQEMKDWITKLQSVDTSSPIKTAMTEGGDHAEQAIRDGADYHARRISQAIAGLKWPKEMFQEPAAGYGLPERVPSGLSDFILELNAESKTMSEGISNSMTESTEGLMESLSSGFSTFSNWSYSALRHGAENVASAIEKAAKVAGKQMGDDIEKAAKKGTTAKPGMTGMDKAMTAYGFMRSLDIPDWTRERGGGWRAAGYGVGAGVGLAVGGPPGAMIGAMIGQEVVSIGQDIKDWLSSETTRTVAPRTESLREQLSGTISRGQFREAAQITYNVQNTVMMDFFIPDAMQMKRAIPIIKAGLEDYGNNVSVGR